MTYQIPVKLGRVGHNTIHHGTCGTVPAPICVTRILCEEPDVVAFGDNDHRDFGVDLQFLASV